jgi:hypothetical protein
MVASIGNGAAFSRGRDFGAWLGLFPNKPQQVTARSSAACRSGGTATCARSWSRPPAYCCSGRPSGASTV